MFEDSLQATDNCLALDELLWKQYSASENFHGQKFVCMETVMRELDYSRVQKWTEEHPLYQRSERRGSDADLIYTILTESRLLFTMLVLGRQEKLFSTLTSSGCCDETLFDSTSFEECCLSAELNESDRAVLVKSRKRIGAILRNDKHQILPRGSVLPYRNMNHPKEDRFGGFGVVRRVEIAPVSHLF